MNQAQAWKAKGREVAQEECVDLLLPSGMTIRARRPGTAFLLAHGSLPMSLANVVDGGVPGAGELSNRQMVDLMATMRDMLIYCVVEPAISLTPDETQIHPQDIPDGDTKFIFAWATRGEEAARLTSFRRGRDDAERGGDREGVPRKAKRTGGDKGRVGGAGLRPRGGEDLVQGEGRS